MQHLFSLLLTFVSIVTYSAHMVVLKSTRKRLLVLFWANLFAYIGYLGIYFFRKEFLEHDVNAVHKLLYDLTLVNMPLYILMALCWVGSIVVLNYLMENFEISLITPVTEVGIVFTTIGYLALGNQFSWPVLLSVTLVFIGAIISGMQTFKLSAPFKDLKKIPHALLIGGTIEAGFEASAMLITFLCTHETNVTEEILAWLTNQFHHIYNISFSFRHPFYYNVGVRFFITLIFLLYIMIFRKHRWDIITDFRKNSGHIAFISLLFLTTTITYHEAYLGIHDKNVLAALRQLIIPTTLIISHIFLKEKVTRPKVIGCAIIVLGGMLSLVV